MNCNPIPWPAASLTRRRFLADESEATKRLYGLDNPLTAAAGRNFLLARRLLERGVRFVQIYNGAALGGNPRINWDAHEDVKTNHDAQGVLLDKPCAGLLKDLKQRGLLDDTLVFWSSEFGRTPFTEGIGAKGRDHHPLVFTGWLAGAGLKKGIRYGASDEVGYQVAEKPITVYDFHATILHLLGIDHTRLTFYHNGIQRRLTDVHGHVIDAIRAEAALQFEVRPRQEPVLRNVVARPFAPRFLLVAVRQKLQLGGPSYEAELPELLLDNLGPKVEHADGLRPGWVGAQMLQEACQQCFERGHIAEEQIGHMGNVRGKMVNDVTEQVAGLVAQAEDRVG